MRTEHRLRIVGSCPVDESVLDVYDVTVTINGAVLPVEQILEAAQRATLTPAFQESITQQLADDLGCHVRTVGTHSGVETTCEAHP